MSVDPQELVVEARTIFEIRELLIDLNMEARNVGEDGRVGQLLTRAEATIQSLSTGILLNGIGE